MAAFVSNPANFSDFFRDRASLGGAVYGVPLFRGQVSLFYNLDMFKAAGLTKPPATMDEYNTYAEKLTQRSGTDVTRAGYQVKVPDGRYMAEMDGVIVGFVAIALVSAIYGIYNQVDLK